MAKVFIEEITLTAIGDAIRGKEGTADLVPVNDMATRITNLPSGGGGNEPTDEELTISGPCIYKFAYTGWNWFLDKYKGRLATKDITNTNNMFTYNTALTEIPFQINVTNCENFSSIFASTKLKVCPKIRGTIKWSTNTTFEGGLKLEYLRDINDLFAPEMLEGYPTFKVTSKYSSPDPPELESLRSLRSIPSWWYTLKPNPESTAFPAYTLYYDLYNLHALSELTNAPVPVCAGAATSNLFQNAFGCNSRMANFTFEVNEDGTPKVANWKAQTLDLSNAVGYAKQASWITDYNSGLTTAKRVTDDASYQALKNDPDWWTTNIAYSRYNHDSVVATINSLPDTSAYLATAGGTNTIKFKKGSGSSTDGGDISALTEEEIAVATAKGWTVTLVA